MFPLAGSTSAKTGSAPQNSTACAVATWVIAGTTTWSPGPTPCAYRARWSPAVQDDSVTACATPTRAAKALSKASETGPCTSCGPARTRVTASISSGPSIGRPNGIIGASVIDGVRFICHRTPQCCVLPRPTPKRQSKYPLPETHRGRRQSARVLRVSQQRNPAADHSWQ